MSLRISHKVKNIRAFLLDVDGVFTDGSFYLTANADEIKQFHTHDGLGLKRLQKMGLLIGIISGRSSESVTHRMKELDITEVYQGISDKMVTYEKFIKAHQLVDSQVAYMGDDLPDLALIKRVGLGIAPANAVSEVKQQADWVTMQGGGHGAIREVCDFIVSIQG